MFTHVIKETGSSIVKNAWGHALQLPCKEDFSNATIPIGVLGTRSRIDEVKKTKEKGTFLSDGRISESNLL